MTGDAGPALPRQHCRTKVVEVQLETSFLEHWHGRVINDEILTVPVDNKASLSASCHGQSCATCRHTYDLTRFHSGSWTLAYFVTCSSRGIGGGCQLRGIRDSTGGLWFTQTRRTQMKTRSSSLKQNKKSLKQQRTKRCCDLYNFTSFFQNRKINTQNQDRINLVKMLEHMNNNYVILIISRVFSFLVFQTLKYFTLLNKSPITLPVGSDSTQALLNARQCRGFVFTDRFCGSS